MSEVAAAQTAITDIETAAQRVLERIGIPLHERATVATLESEGLRDADAPTIDPTCEDLFALGHWVHARALELSESAATLTVAGPVCSVSVRPPSWRRILRAYRVGIGYSLPLIATGLGVLVLGISLWGSSALSPAAKTGMALGVLLSLVTTGPFTYAMTRRIFYYWYQRDAGALARTVYRWTLGAAICGASCAAIAVVWSTVLGGATELTVTLACILLLQAPIWTCTSALFVMRRAWIGGAVLVVPVVPLWVALRTGAPPLPAHLAAVTVAVGLLLFGTWWVLHQLPVRAAPARAPLPARLMPLSIGGFAAWGATYYLLLFGDRLVAWISSRGVSFQPGYETALELALIPLIFAMPLLEFTLIRVAEHIDDVQQTSDLGQAQRLGVHTQAILARTVGIALLIFASLAALILAGARFADQLLPYHAGTSIGHGPGWTSLTLAMVAYGLLVVGLGIGTIFQLLARPWSLVRAGIIGVIANVVVGAFARDVYGPQFAALGLLAGTATFALVMVLTWLHSRPKIAQWWAAT